MLRRRALSGVLLLAVPGPAPAQQNPFVGTWRGVAKVQGRSIGFTLAMGADHRYSQQLAMGSYMTMQAGRYGFPARNTVSFEVFDWEPKTQSVYKPYGTRNGVYVQEPVARPEGGTFRFQFASPHSFTLQDVKLGGTITFNRVQ